MIVDFRLYVSSSSPFFGNRINFALVRQCCFFHNHSSPEKGEKGSRGCARHPRRRRRCHGRTSSHPRADCCAIRARPSFADLMPLGKFLVCLLKVGRGFGVPHLITRNQLCCIQRGRNVLGAELLFRTLFCRVGCLSTSWLSYVSSCSSEIRGSAVNSRVI